MGEENIKLGDGVLYIEGKEFGPTKLSSFECDIHKVFEEHEDEIFTVKDMVSRECGLTFTMKFNAELFYKLTGLWDWICDNCPNRKVVHQMKHAKKKRVRKKNFKRALRIVGGLLDKG